MRRFLIVLGIVIAVIAGGAGAVLVFPQITELAIRLTCSMTDPNKSCQQRMLAMGHVWSLKGDLDRATIWYARAAQKHMPAALFHLAWAIEEGGYADVKQRVRQLAGENAGFAGSGDNPLLPGGDKFAAAAKLYRMAADEGFAPAANNLGDLYLSGVLGKDREEDAFRLHLAAAKAGNPVASLNVSLDYRVGRGTVADPVAADKYATLRPQPDSPDLGKFTLSRTRLGGTAVDPHMLAMIRDAAERHEPITVNFRPL
jgi:TPR repeat protein